MQKSLFFPLILLFSACMAPVEEDESVRRLEDHVKTLVEDFSPRTHRHPENLDACADFIAEVFRAQGAAVQTQPFEVNGITYQNITALFGDPQKPRWVVGAHYDAHEGTPGADDNASGVAGLMEIARRLGHLEDPPTVELVAYTLEEPPYFGSKNMGSYVHAESLSRAGTDVRGMLALEMIGFFSDRKGSQQYSDPAMDKVYPDKGNFIAVISRMDQVAFTRQVHRAMAAGTELPVEFSNAPEKAPGVDFSDHRNYWIFDYPAVMITDTAFMRNPEYHRRGDTPESLDYVRMAQVIDGVMNALLTLP